MTGLRTFGLCLAAAAMLATGSAAANPSQAIDNTKDICSEVTARTERAEGVPRLLLRAISLAETGRWDDEQKASFAWPWAVTAEAEGRAKTARMGTGTRPWSGFCPTNR